MIIKSEGYKDLSCLIFQRLILLARFPEERGTGVYLETVERLQEVLVLNLQDGVLLLQLCQQGVLGLHSTV